MSNSLPEVPRDDFVKKVILGRFSPSTGDSSQEVDCCTDLDSDNETNHGIKSSSQDKQNEEEKKLLSKDGNLVVFEFGGRCGVTTLMILLPCSIYTLVAWTRGIEMLPKLDFDSERLVVCLNWVSTNANLFIETFDTKIFGLVCAWFAFHLMLERFLFLDVFYGSPLSTGHNIQYRMNGHLQFWVTFIILVHGYPHMDQETGKFLYMGHFPLSYVYDNSFKLITTSISLSLLFSVYLYAKSCKPGAQLAPNGNTGYFLYDFFMGRELNPRIGNFEFKLFCKVRLGLIGWGVMNAGCALKQYELFGYVTPEMVLLNVCQGLYIWDALFHEKFVFNTLDITKDGFGFMLAFGQLVWLPFTYSLQTQYLVKHSPRLQQYTLMTIFMFNMVGYWIFRASNSQKNCFRHNPDSPDFANFETITTKTGRKLLVSGWWGKARKINYTGDIMMAIAWCILTGHKCVVTYFYAVYMFVLLIHRAYRDDRACANKYGEDWAEYKRKVPNCFIPFFI